MNYCVHSIMYFSCRMEPSRDARLEQLRAQLKSGREALDAFAAAHGRTAEYDEFGASLAAAPPALHACFVGCPACRCRTHKPL